MSEALRLWLSQELDRRGWSHRELARQTGFSQSFVSKTLSGERSISVKFCTKAAEALGESPDTLLRLAGILPPSSPASPSDNPLLQEIVELARNLPPKQLKELLRYTRYLYRSDQEEA